MIKTHDHPFVPLLESLLGSRRRDQLMRLGTLPAAILAGPGAPGSVGQAEVALALACGLLDDLCTRVPAAEAYLVECDRAGRGFVFDHGAMRTVAAPSGALPAGRAAVARILEPLGYTHTRSYPLDRLGMVGYVYTHREHPEDLPQYFVSELDPERFGPEFAARVRALVGTSEDPLPSWAVDDLRSLAEAGALDPDRAGRLVRVLLTAFRRHHREPRLDEYETLAATSPEMAWIATEGHTFNHITDRVADVRAVAERERALGRPIKETVEVSATGRVVQTALRAASVERLFETDQGFVVRRVPGSFLEFISRAELDASGRLDLAFDASNAQGIFKMTDREPGA